MRRQNREIAFDMQSEDPEENPASSLSDGSSTEDRVVSSGFMEEMLSTLDSDRREIVNLKIYCGLTFAEIAEILHIPQGTAAWKYRTALDKMKKLLEKEECYNG